MTAPLFFADDGALALAEVDGELVLGGAEARHAAVVRRIGAGEVVQLADGSGRVAECRVVAAAPDALTVTVLAVHETESPAVRFVLMQALAKGDRDDQAIEAATELGVDAVVPWQAERSIVQWRGERGAKAHRKWAALLRAAAKQSRRPTVPDLEEVVSSRMAVDRLAAATTALVLHEDATVRLADVDLPDDGEVLVVVGPEGGITPGEVAAFEAAGGIPVRLGPTVLRASSAGPAALAVLAVRCRW